MFQHQSGQISIMNFGHELNLTAILDLHVPLTLLFSTNSLRRLTERTRHAHNSVNWAFKPFIHYSINKSRTFAYCVCIVRIVLFFLLSSCFVLLALSRFL